jgi:serine/threonine-protein kinase
MFGLHRSGASVSTATGDSDAAAACTAVDDLANVSTVVSPSPSGMHFSPSLPDADPDAPRYRDRGLLGSGGMGEVRLQQDRWIGREVAVKKVRTTAADPNGLRSLLLREARVQGQLEHPAIVPVYDLGKDDAGRDYFTMKRIGGRTLRGLIGTMSRNKLLGIFRQVCLAIEYAHTRGVVHRDLKPENIMVGDFGEIYVLDWGLAKLLHDQEGDTRPQTQSGQLLGTPGYMAPEQIGFAKEADARSDVYALGAILFEILAREPLHRGATTADLLRSIQDPETVGPSERAPDLDVPPELDALCTRATAFLPKHRIASARELAEAVERYLEGDRDVEARRKFAARHAEAAEAAVACASAGGGEAHEARARALREAGRALALDPMTTTALRIATTLMLEPPSELPDEVRREIEQAATTALRERARIGAFVFGFFLALLAAFPWWCGVRSWIAYLLAVAATGATVAGSIFLCRVEIPFSARRLAILATTACGFAAMVAASWLTTPVVLIPAFVIGLTTTTMADGLRENVWHYLLLGLAALLVPSVLSLAGVMPAIETRADGILLRSLTLRRMPAEILLHLSAIITYLGASISVWFSVRGQSDLRERWLVQLWHLRAMTSVERRDEQR